MISKGLQVLRKFMQDALIFALLFFVFVPVADGKGYMMRRKVNNYTVNVAIDRNPPIVGKNEIRIDIKDLSERYVTKVPVTVNYYMPPMPGMPPMNYTVKAPPDGSGYSAIMDLIMTGPWIIVIRASISGKYLRVSVPIDVR
ncbi:MAG: FixH family protein [Syntrophorhabdaceae bacterium]|nr:FixH family protein [Syntrophorhabdaceae bacterium]